MGQGGLSKNSREISPTTGEATAACGISILLVDIKSADGRNQNMTAPRLPAGLGSLADLIEVLSPEARASYQKRRRSIHASGATLRPGKTTPLWNKLKSEILPLLKPRGEKAQLARLLGVHRQAINEYFTSETRMPDAERTLLLSEWLATRRKKSRVS